jgi:hypothetical protein
MKVVLRDLCVSFTEQAIFFVGSKSSVLFAKNTGDIMQTGEGLRSNWREVVWLTLKGADG